MSSEEEAIQILQAYELWEGKLILFGDWGTRDGLPKFTQELYDEFMEIQFRRNLLFHQLRHAGVIAEAVPL